MIAMGPKLEAAVSMEHLLPQSEPEQLDTEPQSSQWLHRSIGPGLGGQDRQPVQFDRLYPLQPGRESVSGERAGESVTTFTRLTAATCYAVSQFNKAP